MPALRKSTRAPQPTRSSTTPYASPTGTSSDSHGTGKRQSLMTEHWSEPAPQTLAPSFEEHGFARHGVLETMAPLGVPPSAKVKQRTRALGEAAARNAALGKGNIAFGDDVAFTPEVTPARDMDADDSERHDDEETQPGFALLDEDEDDDYEPTKTTTKKKGKISKTPVGGKTPIQGKMPTKNGTAKAAPPSASPAVQPLKGPVPKNVELQRIHTAVNDAIIRANKDNNRQVGHALKEMWEERKYNPEILGIMDAVIHANTNDEQWASFRVFVKDSRKRQRNEAKMRRLQEEQAHRQNAELQEAPTSSKQPSPRASSEVVPDDSVSAVHDMTYQGSDMSKSTKTGAQDAHRALQASLDSNSSLASPHPFNTAPAIPAADASGESAPRMSSKSPRKKPATNGQLVQGSAMDMDGERTPSGKTPETGGGSDSELSDVNEEIVQKGPPEPAQANGKAVSAAAAAAAKKAKSAAFARAAKKSKPNAGKLFGKHAYKQHHQATPEQLADEEQVYETRNEMAKNQPIRQFTQDFPVSDVRFDDEINDTESLTESQIAVGPPVDSGQLRRAGRVPHQGAKRLREDRSRFSSPQVESAVGTRPSTPAVAPAPKRIKLNHGQSARTKRSPVKNREGGPIAGVAFNGGGGSRQLGPDDNNPVSGTQIPEASNHTVPLPPHNSSTTLNQNHPPTQMLLNTNFPSLRLPISPPLSVLSSPLTECQNSPQSDSDDLCSACRGTGEFVCCEGCPRVFHLLCCDPPQKNVPEGSFYCHECTARLGPQEDPAVESYSSLGPLFKSLERINPRAFALPRETQIAFEGVTARADGSYSEEVKKFALAKNSGYGHQKPDYTKLFDADQKPILCTQCGVSSGNTRQLLKCDFCHAHWHLDCLDPPQANPPYIGIDASHRDAWRCPRHIEHDLRSGLLRHNDLNHQHNDVEMVDAVPCARVARKLRKPRNPEVVEPTFTRGMRNNGLIEVINDPDDDTDGEGNYVFGQEESKDLNSKIFRVPEKGVILDFVTKVKSDRVMKKKQTLKPAKRAAQRDMPVQAFLARPMQQQQAALNLARLANHDKNIALSDTSINALLLSLTSEAPESVVTAIDNAAPPPVLADERAQLLKLQELIARRLNG